MEMPAPTIMFINTTSVVNVYKRKISYNIPFRSNKCIYDILSFDRTDKTIQDFTRLYILILCFINILRSITVCSRVNEKGVNIFKHFTVK